MTSNVKLFGLKPFKTFMKIALMFYHFISENWHKTAHVLLIASFVCNVLEGQQTRAQSDKDKSNLTRTVPCVCILNVTAGPWLHTLLFDTYDLNSHWHMFMCVYVCVCSKTIASDDDIKTNKNKNHSG